MSGGARREDSTRRSKDSGRSNNRKKPDDNRKKDSKRGLIRQVLAIGQPNDWRTWLQRMLVVMIAGMLVFVGAFIVAYQATAIPDPNKAFQAQTTYVYYGDGKQIGTFATQNRQSVLLNQVSKYMQAATVAAEDRSFWNNQGIDLKGILRAAFADAKGAAKQGGSTITQQYVKILYLNQERTFTRKIKEIFLSLKVQQQESKQKILEGYLNTIYFGRGAYGIEAAAKAYFNIPASDLNASQSAMLAAIINQPSYLNPTGTPAQRAALLGRYQYVLDGMSKMGSINAATKAPLYRALPKISDKSVENVYSGQKGFAMQIVKDQLIKAGFTEAQIYGSGLRVTTTLTPGAMAASEDGVTKNKPDNLNELHVGTASIDVKSGALLGFYAGQDFLKSQINWALAKDSPGSVFKVFALAMALDNGMSLQSTFSGNSPYSFPDGTNIFNEGEASGITNGLSYGRNVSLLRGLIDSINTVFIDLTASTMDGAKKIRDTATKMGIPANTPGLDPIASISLGSASVSPIDIANAYATVANDGMMHPWFVVQKVADSTGRVLWTHKDNQVRAISSEAASGVRYAMEQVVQQGTGRKALNLGRPVAGKTGTATDHDNKVITSWFAGFTPQVATAVMYVRGNGRQTLEGYMPSYYGSDYPTATWTSIMDNVVKALNLPYADFSTPGSEKSTNDDDGGGQVVQQPRRTSGPDPTRAPAPQATTTAPQPKPAPTTPAPPRPSSPPPCGSLLGPPCPKPQPNPTPSP